LLFFIMMSTNQGAGFKKIPKSCVVTGGSGFVGQRLVEMLVERGCKRVVSFYVVAKPKGASEDPAIEYVKGDLTNKEEVINSCKGVECVFHIAALVGPYHAQEAYVKVNYIGTLNIIEACKIHDVKRIVISSSPSTRFPYPDPNVNGLTEEQLKIQNKGDFAPVFLQPYAETKALGEKAVTDCCGRKETDLLTIAVAPHQVYGPRDGLFLPSLLQTAGSGKLRIFGDGDNVISVCHVDNYCHGLILGHEALYENSPALGKFYIITDGPPVKFWRFLDEAVVAMGFDSLWSKFKLPTVLMMLIATVVVWVGDLYAWVTGTPKHIINYKLKLNPFAVKMLVINRYFDISGAKRDLNYEPVISFEDGWRETIEWFRQNWLPTYKLQTGKTK
jgi:nucleoside-diphosphate-sugar epimerase